MVDKNDTLFREVDEELRRERMEKLWDKYGIYAIGLAAIIVATVGGYKFLDARNRAAAEAGGAQFEQAVALAKAGKTDDAVKAFETLAVSGKPGYATLAELNVAGALVKAGKNGEALAAFEKLAANSGTDPLIAGFAQLQAAGLRLGEADFTEVKNRLTPLVADNSAWKAAATEMLGTAAIKAGKLDEARTTLAPLLADPKLSRTGVERIRTLLATIAGMETGQVQAATPPSSGAATPPSSGAATAVPEKSGEAGGQNAQGEKK